MSHKDDNAKMEQTVIVTVRSDQLAQIDDVTQKLQAAGMVIDNVLKTLGQVTGHASPDAVEGLRKVEQVESVSAQRVVRIAPPDAEIQ